MTTMLNTIPAASATIDYSALVTALTNACRVVERKFTDRILTYVMITAVDNGVSVYATDLDMTVSTFVPASVTPGLSALVPAHTLLDVLKKAGRGYDVELTPTETGVDLSIGDLSISLTAEQNLGDYPSSAPCMAQLKKTNCSFRLPAAMLRDAFDKLSIAISTEETRYYLNGVFLHVQDKQLVAVSTDGHRLARSRTALPDGAEPMPGIIVPRKPVMEVLRLLKRKDCPEEVRISATGSAISFLIGENELIETKVIDGTFPDYHRVIPQPTQMSVEVDPAQVIAAVKKVTVITSERGRAVKLTASDDGLAFECNNPDAGVARTAIKAKNTGETREIGFNSEYLTDVMGKIEGWAKLHFDDAGAPCLVTDMARDDVDYVQMPMRV